MCKQTIKNETKKITNLLIKKKTFSKSFDLLMEESIDNNLKDFKFIIIYEIIKELSNLNFSITCIDPFIIKEI